MTTTEAPPQHDSVSAVVDIVKDAQDRLQDVDHAVRHFVVERPFVAIGIALAGGFVVGRILQRL